MTGTYTAAGLVYISIYWGVNYDFTHKVQYSSAIYDSESLSRLTLETHTLESHPR